MAVMLTGDRPTGPLHLGHYFGSLRERVKLQEDPEVETYVLMADAQAYTDHAEQPEQVRKNVLEVMLDYLAVGIDPTKSTIFVQTGVPEIHELSIYLMNLISFSRLEANPTVKQEIRQKGMGSQVPAGFVFYPIHQAADILVVKGEIVPVGDDQRPMIELAAEVAARFNRIYDEVFPKPYVVTPEGGRLPGIDGGAKASKTMSNAIDLKDPADVVAEKVMAMYTDPNKASVADPGQVEGHVPFAYLDAFDPDFREVMRLKEQYRAGGLGDVVIKRRLIDVLESLLGPIRARREVYAQDPAEVMRLLQQGTLRTREVAQTTLDEVRAAMQLDYFAGL